MREGERIFMFEAHHVYVNNRRHEHLQKKLDQNVP